MNSAKVFLAIALLSPLAGLAHAQNPAPLILTGISGSSSPGQWMRNIAIGQDGFARISTDGWDPNNGPQINLVRCLDGGCGSTNNTVAGPGRDASLAIGNDGFPRLVYVDNQEVLHFFRCADADCAGSVESTPLIAPGAQCNTGPPDYQPLSGVYCASGDVYQVFIGSSGLPQILFDWQNAYYQNITLSLASCADDACDAVTVTDIGQVINEDMVSGSVALGLDGNPLVAYVDTQNWGPTSGPAYFVQCTDAMCDGSAPITIGTGDTGYSIDVAIGPDGFGRVVFEDASETQIDFVQCTSDDCSMNNQASIPLGLSEDAPIYLAVGGDGNAGIAVGILQSDYTNAVNYVACTVVDCSSNGVEGMPQTVESYGMGMTFDGDGLPRMVGEDPGTGGTDYMYEQRVTITSISPAQGLVGTAVNVTITGTGFASGATIQAGTSISVSNVSVSSSTKITATFTIENSADAGGGWNVSVTVSSQTSNSKTFFGQVPSALQVMNASVLPTGTSGDYGCNPVTNGDFGIGLDVTYLVLDQQNPSQPIASASMVPWEDIPDVNPPVDQPVCPSRVSTCAPTTAADGTWHDAPLGSCFTSSFSTSFTQTISMDVGSVGYPVRTNHVTVSSTASGHGSITNGSDINKSR